MPIARFQMPDGRVARFEVPEGTTPEQAQSMIAAQVGEQQPEQQAAPKEQSVMESLGRQTGLTGRYLAEGLASTAGIVSDPVAVVMNKLGANIPSLRSSVDTLLDRAGAPKPQGGLEEAVAAPSRALASVMGFGGAGAAANLAKAPNVAKVFTSSPGLQAKSAVGGSVAGETLRQAGAPEWAQIAGNVGGALLAGRGIDPAKQAQNAVRDKTIQEARKAGYVVPPVQANPSTVNRALEGWAGKISTAQGASIKNQAKINEAARKTLGLADDVPITKDTLDAIRANAGQAYEAVASVGKIPTDMTYKTALMSAARQNASMMQKFPQMAVKEIDDLANGLAVGNMDGEDAVMLIRQLRNDASLNIAARDPAKAALGQFQKKASNAIEDMVGRHLDKTGNKDLLGAFKEARQTIAKTYSIEDALNESTGNVVGRKLAQQYAKGKPLTGPLREAARTSQALPRATQEVTSSMPGISPLDMAVGAIGSTSMQSPAFMSYVLGRPAIRSMLLSQPYQSMMLNPNYTRGLLNINPERVLGAQAASVSR